MDAWRRDIQAGHDEAPIIEEAQYPIDGRIMHMDFLSAGAHEEDPHVVLVFIVVHEGKTKIETYDWNFESNLDAMPRRSRSILDFGKYISLVYILYIRIQMEMQSLTVSR